VSYFLAQLRLEKKWQMNASCTVECPINCQLSDWSAWSDCSQTCGLEGKAKEWRNARLFAARIPTSTVKPKIIQTFLIFLIYFY